LHHRRRAPAAALLDLPGVHLLGRNDVLVDEGAHTLLQFQHFVAKLEIHDLSPKRDCGTGSFAARGASGDSMVMLADIEAAAAAIRDAVPATPFHHSVTLSAMTGAELWIK